MRYGRWTDLKDRRLRAVGVRHASVRTTEGNAHEVFWTKNAREGNRRMIPLHEDPVEYILTFEYLRSVRDA